MRPLETEHRGWTIRVTTRAVGPRWCALVEVSAPDAPDGDAPQVVPFSQMLSSEKAAQEAGRIAAVRWLDRADRPAR